MRNDIDLKRLILCVCVCYVSMCMCVYTRDLFYNSLSFETVSFFEFVF